MDAITRTIQRGRRMNRVFTDGILYIICRPDIDKGAFGLVDVKCKMKILNAEFDEPISLNMIAKKFPDVDFIIFDDLFEGEIWAYNNDHKDSGWEQRGTTKGFA